MIAEGDGVIIPTWTEADPESVLTMSELWKSLHDRGWNVHVGFMNTYSFMLTVQSQFCQYHR